MWFIYRLLPIVLSRLGINIRIQTLSVSTSVWRLELVDLFRSTGRSMRTDHASVQCVHEKEEMCQGSDDGRCIDQSCFSHQKPDRMTGDTWVVTSWHDVHPVYDAKMRIALWYMVCLFVERKDACLLYIERSIECICCASFFGMLSISHLDISWL